MLWPTPAERISEDTWNRLKQAQELEVRLGEETLTDILSLDFARLAGTHEIKLFQTPKPEEAKERNRLGSIPEYGWRCHDQVCHSGQEALSGQGIHSHQRQSGQERPLSNRRS
jgi:hypothetical protein